MTISATTQGLRPGVCTSTSRPSVPFDGMLIYETDTNRVAVYDTNAWVYKTPDTTAGSVLQVVSTTKTDTFSTSSTSMVDITGLSVTITPKFDTSKILVRVSFGAIDVSAAAGVYMQCVRGSTAIGVGATAGSRTSCSIGLIPRAASSNYSAAFDFLDSPATTTATTYKFQMRMTGSTGYINRDASDTDVSSAARTVCTITVMEIAQ